MNAPVFIAGVGAISAIGNNSAECLDALAKEQTGVGSMRNLKSVHSNGLPVAEVKLGNEGLAKLLGLSKIVSRTAMLSMMAAKEACQNASIPDVSAYRSGFISANT